MSGIFTEVFSEYDDVSWLAERPDRRFDAIGTDPGNLLFDFLLKSDEKTRKSAVSAWSQMALFLLKKIEARRSRVKNQALSIKRNVYSAFMLIDEIDVVADVAKRLGLDWTNVSDIGPNIARDIIRNVPNFHIERELVLKIETQSRSITENDLRDMWSFCATMPYCQMIVAENNFIGMSKQAKLDTKYDVKLSNNISNIRNLEDF